MPKLEEKKSKTKVITKNRYGLEQWKALITSFLLQSLIMGTLESYGALYVPMKVAILNNDPNKNTKASLIGSATTGFMMGFSPISSILIEKHGSQLMALVGSYLIFFSTLITSFVETYFLVLFLYGAMFGIGASLLTISSNVVISRYFEENSTIAYGILGLGNGLMNAIMPHVMNFAVENIKLAGTIRLICFMLSFIMFFPLFWNMSELPIGADEPFNPFLTSQPKRKDQKKLDKPIEDSDSYKSAGGMLHFNRMHEWVPSHSDNPKATPKIPDIVNRNSHNNPMRETSRNKHNNNKHVPVNMKPIPDHSSFKPTMINEVVTEISSIQDDTLPRVDYVPNTNLHPLESLNQVTPLLFTSTTLSTSTIDNPTVFYGRNVTSESKDSFAQLFRQFNICRNSPVLANKAFVTLLCAMPIAMLGYQVPNIHIVNFAAQTYPQENGQLLLTCLGAASAIGPFINALILNRLPCQISKYRLYQIIVIAYGMVVLTLAISSNYYQVIVICIVIGYLDGSFTSLMGPLAIDLVGGNLAGQAIGMYYGVIATSVMIAPTLAGYIYDYTTDYRPAFYTAGVCFLCGGLLLSISCTQTQSNSYFEDKDHDGNESYEVVLNAENAPVNTANPGHSRIVVSSETTTTDKYDLNAIQTRPLFKRHVE